ncbi:MAG TPA: hypothetical protein VFY92_04650 [Hyphomicrobiaceae bacterium]|nr:hypothetical protein [Hyphomicrobiaceae bacterium]
MIDPWIVRQLHDELDAIKAAGEDVPPDAYDVACDLGHLVEEGVSPRIVAEHAIELTRRGFV